MTSAMPTGGVDSPSGGQATSDSQGGSPSAASAGWMPVCKMGQGVPGVFTDAKELIAGGSPSITAASVAAAGDAAAGTAMNQAGIAQQGALANGGANQNAVPGLGDTTFGAGTMPTGGSR